MPRLVLAMTLGTFVITAILFQAIPKGFFPSEDIGQLSALDGRSRRRLVRRHGGPPGGRWPRSSSAIPTSIAVMSTVGGGNAANT